MSCTAPHRELFNFAGDGYINHGRSHQASKIDAGRAHSESQETKNRAAGATSSFHEGQKESRAPQAKGGSRN